MTTQKGVRSAILSLSRRYRIDCHFDRSTLKGKWYTGLMFVRTKSLEGNVGAQVIANKEYFCTAHPADSKRFYGKALKYFAHNLVHQKNSPLTVSKSKSNQEHSS